ncbi:MAG: hypothetical protein PF589_02930 [Gammaproteobacteria bacterium]|jgi:O6-methylguanine-DNA--protein-cysteine methyltransferase|nr:hypothetical protein [Gammaproteobacteria bacterium]
MLIDGPFDLKIMESDGSRELHITYKEAYRALDLSSRVQQMQQHLQDLEANYQASSDPAEQQGMQMLMQVVSQILPYLETDEISLDEAIVLELEKTSAINNLINDASLN